MKSNIYKICSLSLIIVFILLGTIGCSGSNAKKVDTTSSTNANKDETKADASTTETKKEDTKVTYENFVNIKMGQSYNEVVSLLGEGTESSSSEVNNTKTTMYKWAGKGAGNISITIQNDIVITKAQFGLTKNKSDITKENYDKIQNGMTYDQVKSILGEGQVISESEIGNHKSIMYSYVNKNGANANFSFTDNSMSMKAQANLK